MRTNIEIDDRLMRDAMRASGGKTKRAVVEAALRLLVQTKAQAAIRRLRGQVEGMAISTSADWTASRRAASRGHRRHDRLGRLPERHLDATGRLARSRTHPRQRLGFTDLILCEVLQGLPSDQQAARVLRDLRQFEIFDTGSVELAVAAGSQLSPPAFTRTDCPQDHRLPDRHLLYHRRPFPAPQRPRLRPVRRSACLARHPSVGAALHFLATLAPKRKAADRRGIGTVCRTEGDRRRDSASVSWRCSRSSVVFVGNVTASHIPSLVPSTPPLFTTGTRETCRGGLRCSRASP